MQQSHTGMGVDLCGVALACGLERASRVSTEVELQSVVRRYAQTGTLGFVQVKVDPETPSRVMPTRDAVENKIDFRRALGVVE